MTFNVLQNEGRESVWLVRIDLCSLLLSLVLLDLRCAACAGCDLECFAFEISSPTSWVD